MTLAFGWMWPGDDAPRPAHPASEGEPGPGEAVTFRPLLPDSPHCQDSLRSWAGAIPVSLLAGAMAQVEDMPDAIGRVQSCRALLEVWVRHDPRAVGMWFGQDGTYPEVELRMEARDPLLQMLGQMTPQTALAWMSESLSENAKSLLKDPFFRQWTGNDPAAACNELYQQGDRNLLGDMAALWAVADVEAAARGVRSLPEGDLQSAAMSPVINQWTKHSPSEAAAFAGQSGDPDLIREVAGQWAFLAPLDAAGWIADMPSSHHRDLALTHLSSIWAQSDPVAAATYVARLPEGSAQDQAVEAVVSTWTLDSPMEAAAWVAKFPESATREVAIRQLIATWAPSQPTEAGRWIRLLPDSGSADVAVAAYSRRVMEQFPEIALQWADSITSEPLRHKHLEEVAITWMQKDRQAALAAVAGSSLPASRAERLFAPEVELP